MRVRGWASIAFVLLAGALASIVSCQRARPDVTADAAPAPGCFRDVTGESGVDFTCRNGEEADHLTLLESLGGGVALRHIAVASAQRGANAHPGVCALRSGSMPGISARRICCGLPLRSTRGTEPSRPAVYG